MKTPPIVSPQEWDAARQELLVEEKRLTRARGALAARRRRMPWMAVEKQYRFDGPQGEVNAWSEVRLPFEPKGEMLEFRQQLVAAIKAMPPACDGQLVATYTAADPNALIDTENVLFYNVGLGCFSAHTEEVARAIPVTDAAASTTAARPASRNERGRLRVPDRHRAR
jgi:hypothetical protein